MDPMMKEYVTWCKANGLKPCMATSLDAFKNYLEANGRKLG